MKYKILLALFLALILLVAGALLPHIAGTMMDASVLEKIQFANTSEIQLEFTQSDVPMEEILGVMCNATHHVEVPSDLAKHSASKIKQLAAQSISHYVNAGLFPLGIDPAADFRSAVPELWYEQASNRKSNLFWTLIYAPENGSWELEMKLDDRTGAVCAMYYTCMDTAASGPLYEDRKAAVAAFADLFLADLGENAPDAELGTPTLSADEYTASAILTWPDTPKGECHVVFYVHDYAMYTIHY